MIIDRKSMAKQKLEKIKKGYSAFAETKEIADLLEKQLIDLDIPVHIDRTSVGCWFIPDETYPPKHTL